MTQTELEFRDGICAVEFSPGGSCASPVYRTKDRSLEMQIKAGERLEISCKSPDEKQRRVDLLVKRGDQVLFSDFCVFDGAGSTVEAPVGDSAAPVTVTMHEPVEVGVLQPERFRLENFRGLTGSESEVVKLTWETQIANGSTSDMYDVLGVKVLLTLRSEQSGEYGLHIMFLEVGARTIVTAYTCEIENVFDEKAKYCMPQKSLVLVDAVRDVLAGKIEVPPSVLVNPNAGFVGRDGRAKITVTMRLRERGAPRRVEKKTVEARGEPECSVFRSDVIPENVVVPIRDVFHKVVEIRADDLKKGSVVIGPYVCDSVSYKCTLCLAENSATLDFGFDQEKVFVYMTFRFVANNREQSKAVCVRKVYTKSDHTASFSLPLSASQLEDPKWLCDGLYRVVVDVRHLLRKLPSDEVIPVKPTNNKYSLKWEIPVENLKHGLVKSPKFGIDSMTVMICLQQVKGTTAMNLVFTNVMTDAIVEAHGLVGTFPFNGTCVVTRAAPYLAFNIISEGQAEKLEDAFRDGLLTVAVTILYEHPRHNRFYKLAATPKAEETHVTVSEAPRTVTGYVGLLNQGATCYMNSILQALFHLPAFRKLVYNIETLGLEDTEKSITLNLQRLFCEMQLSDKPCSTKNVTKSFGWGSEETFIQHDIEEFLRVLMDNLEMKMVGTPLQDAIPDIFRGKMRNYIRCVNVPYESSREEDFMDLSMDVKGCRTLYESFKRYTTPEKLEGDNQYSTDEFGKQDAIMGVELYRIPSVLHLHLRRFQYDYATDRISKVVDRFEFPTEIDLTEFLAKDSPDLKKSNVFDLYGVLVHSGGVYGGHYYAYLRTSTDTQWYLFNDSRVSFATMEEAVCRNYGADQTPTVSSVRSREFDEYRRSRHYSMERKHKLGSESSNEEKNQLFTGKVAGSTQFSGYMLIYVRREDAPRIMERIPDDAVPQHLKDFMQHQQEEELETGTVSLSQSSDLTVKYTMEDALRTLCAAGVTGFTSPEVCNTKEIPRDMKLSELYDMMKKEFELSSIRLWLLDTYSGNLSRYIPCCDKEVITLGKSPSIFVQKIPEGEAIDVGIDEIVVFTKFYFPQAKVPLQYIMALRVGKTTSFAEIGLRVKQRLGFPDSIELLAYSLSWTIVKQLVISDAIGSGWSAPNTVIFECTPGTPVPPVTTDFVLVEPIPCEPEKKPEESDGIPHYNISEFTATHAESFANYFSKTKETTLNMYNLEDRSKLLFRLTLPESTTIDALKEVLPKIPQVGHVPNTQIVLAKETVGAFCGGLTLIDEKTWKVVNTAFNSRDPQMKALFCSVEQSANLTDMRICIVQISLDGRSIESEFAMAVPTPCTCNYLLGRLSARTQLEGKFRMLHVKDSVIRSVYDENTPCKLDSYYVETVRIERIPDDQLKLDPEKELLRPCLFALYTGVQFREYEPMGQPFVFILKRGEKFSDTKSRLIPYLDLSDAEQVKNFCFMVKPHTYATAKEMKDVKDDSLLYDLMYKPESTFMIVSGAGGSRPKRTSSSSARGITIYN